MDKQFTAISERSIGEVVSGGLHDSTGFPQHIYRQQGGATGGPSRETACVKRPYGDISVRGGVDRGQQVVGKEAGPCR